MQLTYTQFYLYVLLGQLVVGILLGLIPFFLGRKRGRPSLGNWGLLVTIIAGAVSPLGAIIAVAIYVWLIVKKPSPASETTSGE
jgi:membrane protein DedA with SNARE-associated domain